jgi:HTH-type transcriptional regulator/antitoxin HigA
VAPGKTTEVRPPNRTSDRYFGLTLELPLRPLRTDRELDRAIAIIDRLLARSCLAGDEKDYLDVLSDLVEKYEDQRFPIEPISGLDALRHLIDSSGKTRATIAVESGLPMSTLSEILLGRRRLNTRHIAILARYFRIDPGVFLDAPAGPSQEDIRDGSRKNRRLE